MQTNARLAIQLLAAFVVIIVIFLCAPLFYPISSVNVRGVQTQNMSNARQLGIACMAYANDHQGRFPIHLGELEPDYVTDLKSLRCVSVGLKNDPKYMMDWLYFGAGFDENNLPQLLIASPQATTTREKQQRVVIHGDVSGNIIEEAKYQQWLAETVLQIRALDDARHPAKPSPADAAPK